MSSGRLRLWGVPAVCVAFSVAGVAYAALCSSAADGGRGGAIAVALTFIMLFLDRGTARAVLENDEPQDQQTRTHNAFAAFLDWDSKQRWPLVVSSVTGTIFWGFGDVFAAWLGAPNAPS